MDPVLYYFMTSLQLFRSTILLTLHHNIDRETSGQCGIHLFNKAYPILPSLVFVIATDAGLDLDIVPRREVDYRPWNILEKMPQRKDHTKTKAPAAASKAC